MEANIFSGSVGEIPPSQAYVSSATWLKLADYYDQQKVVFFIGSLC